MFIPKLIHHQLYGVRDLNAYLCFPSLQMLQLSDKYDWIEKEKHQFGNRGGLYDFHENNPKEVEKRLNKLEEHKEKLGRNVNARAMNLLSKEEEQV